VQFARPDGDGCHVLARFGLRVAKEVLGTGDHAVAQIVPCMPR
jgi:hypothetical protein